MAVSIVMPRQGNTVESCLIVEWRIKEGDWVKKGDAICMVETDKTTFDVESDASGTVLSLLYQAGDDVPVLSPIVILGEPGEDISSLAAREAAPPEAAAAASPRGTGAEANPVLPSGSNALGPDKGISPRARKAAERTGIDWNTIHGTGPGGRILAADVISRAEALPALTGAAREAGIRPGSGGSGVGGRVLSTDTGPADAAKESDPDGITGIPLKGIRRIIADRMRGSLRETAQFTLNASAPAELLLKWREDFKGSDESLGLGNVTIGDMVVFATSRILPRFPGLNALLVDGTIFRHRNVNVGIAVDTPRGLMVPVIRNADRKTLRGISAESKRLARGCLDKSADPDDLAGGTFTVTNLGAFGIESFTPVLNPPQVCILGVCAIRQLPVSRGGMICLEPYIGLSLTIDHQAVDGAEGARFLKELSVLLGGLELMTAL